MDDDTIPEEVLRAVQSALMARLRTGGPFELAEVERAFPGHEWVVRREYPKVLRLVEVIQPLRQAHPPGLELSDSRSRPALPCPGEIVGDFEIEERIAGHPMYPRALYRARQISLGLRPVALKVFAMSAVEAARFDLIRGEATAAASVDHPHLAKIFAYHRSERYGYYAMEWVRGSPLLEIVQEGSPLTVRKRRSRDRALVRIVEQIAGALHALHEKKILHLDVKPGNIVLEFANGATTLEAEPDGRPVLVDFGSARILGAAQTGVPSVSAGYTAPEVRQSSKDLTFAADVYSLGATLHDLLLIDRGQSVDPRTVDGRTDLEPGISADLDAIIAKSTAHAPERRYASAAEFAGDLECWRRGDEPSFRPWSPWRRVKRRLELARPRMLRQLTGLFALMVGAWVVSLFLHWSESAFRARQALARHDFIGVRTAVREIPSAVSDFVLRGSEIRAVRDRIAGGEKDDVMTHMLSCLDSHDVEGACFAAATRLRVAGFESEPLAHGFLVAQLESGRLAPVAIALSRLLYERPVEERRDLVATRELREAIARVVFSHSPAAGLPNPVLHLITALGQSAGPEQLNALVHWVSHAEEEPLRVGLAAVERSLRRAHGCEFLNEIDVETIVVELGPILRDALAVKYDRSASPMRHRLAAVALMTEVALGTVWRSRGQSQMAWSLARDTLPPEWRDWIERNEAWRLTDLLLIAAACDFGDPQEWLPRPTDPLHGGIDAAQLAEAAGLLGEPKWISVARTSLLEQVDPDDRALFELDFERGLARGTQRLEGRLDEELLDPDTHLGATDLPSDTIELHSTVAGSEPTKLVAPWTGADIDSELAIAWWDFRTDPCTVSAAECPVKVKRAVLAREAPTLGSPDHNNFLSMRVLGESLVELSLFPTREQTEGRFEIVLAGQMNERHYFPREGVASIEVYFDGEFVARIAHSSIEVEPLRVPLDFRRMSVGPHCVTIRLGPESTTPFRLHWAAFHRLQRPR